MSVVNSSTPLLNVLQMLKQARLHNGVVYTATGVAFLATFAVTRLLLVPWLSYRYYVEQRLAEAALTAAVVEQPTRIQCRSGTGVAVECGVAVSLRAVGALCQADLCW